MSTNLQDIVQVVEVTYSNNANLYLNLGWVIINVYGSENNTYVLGWDKSNGEIKHPNPEDICDPYKSLENNPLMKAFLDGE